jgi:NADH dehydrogenase
MGAEKQVVTGAFGYSGKVIAERLLEQGVEVATLTNSLERGNPFGGRVKAMPYNFDQPLALAESLRGVAVLYNTYWVRFNRASFGHALAVENTLRLFEAAQKAGVRRVVHISILNPDESSPFEYYRGKARLERELIASGLSYCILRPAVLFGRGDILINNIAWMLRRLPVFGIFGDGQYKLQPVHVDDLARLAVEGGASAEARVIDALGPEAFTYRGLVQALAGVLGLRRPLLPVPARAGYWMGWLMGKMLGDVVVTREELGGLLAGLLYNGRPATGSIKLTEWAKANAATLGRHYASELARRRDRKTAYGLL